MASGTKTRPFLRLLEASGVPLYVIGPTGQLVYLSAGCADWLHIDVDRLLDRRCVAGTPVAPDEPLDRLAAALSPPPGLSARGTASLRIQPPPHGDARPVAMEVRFVRLGVGESALTLAVGGQFDDRVADQDLRDAVAIRGQLDRWRKYHGDLADFVTAGPSPAVARLRRRLRVAASTRTDFGIFGPRGCHAESLARNVHHAHSATEPIVAIDGPLMDPELLDAILMPSIHPLHESRQALVTVVIRGLDEMPIEAQLRFVDVWRTFAGRLRLIGLCGPHPTLHQDSDPGTDAMLIEESAPQTVAVALWEILSALTVTVEPLTRRVEDIPLIASAILDKRRAAGEGTAERFSRAALDALVIYPWPRDAQELDEAVRHAIRSSHGETIGVEQLPLAIRSYRPGEGSAAAKRLNLSLDESLSRFELRMIHQALEAADGNRAEAARRLGISRARLLRRLDPTS